MLKSIHITEKDVERLYADFIEHCFPSFYMCHDSFKFYMSKYGFEKSDTRMGYLFRSFNYNKNGCLSFHELLTGLATIEPCTIHGESRVRFIFRYYDVDCSSTLSVDEFKKLTMDLLSSTNPNAVSNPQVLQQKVVEGMRAIGTQMINGTEQITMQDFILAIGSHRFRGTSSLCRSNRPIFTQISRTLAARTLKKLGQAARQNMGAIVRPAPIGKFKCFRNLLNTDW